jgi:hypothetical protein
MSQSTFARPTAWLPIAMSLAAVVTLVGHVVLVGTAREPDEGAAAHLFQLLIAGQVPIVALFAIRWLQRTPRQAMRILAAQAFAIVVALAPVWYLKL